MGPLYYHTKPVPGLRRVTVCGIIKNDKMSFGVARCSKKDTFKKAKGRLIAEARAKNKPNLGIIIPGSVEESGKFGQLFVQKAKHLAIMAQENNNLPNLGQPNLGDSFLNKISKLFEKLF